MARHRRAIRTRTAVLAATRTLGVRFTEHMGVAVYPIRVQVAKPTTPRNRGTVAIRLLMLIPHIVVLYVINVVAQIAMLIQWFICVFTGKRNKGLFDFIVNYIAYAARVQSYGMLLHDVYPKFGFTDRDSPMAFANDFDPNANRLTTLFRFIVAIPAAIISALFGIGAFFMAIGAWFSILITGKMSDGMWDFIHKTLRYTTAVQGYASLTTDTYPWPAAVG